MQTAVPARCLKAGEKLLAVMTSSGELASLSYDLSEVLAFPNAQRQYLQCGHPTSQSSKREETLHSFNVFPIVPRIRQPSIKVETVHSGVG